MGEKVLPFELRKKLKELAKHRGRGTELITVYIPPKYPIGEVSAKLRDEYGQAANIKSKSTRKNVQDALEKILGYLKMFKAPPENGIAIFCGNISEREGEPDIKLFSMVPPEPVTVQLYRCDSAFFLEPLLQMSEAKDVYGLVVMDGRDVTIATLKGKRVEIHRTLHSLAHSKLHGKGGQSFRRYERRIEEEIENYYKKIGENMNAILLNVPGLKGVIVGGPGPAKEDFLKLAPFDYRLKIIGTVDTGYTDEYGVRELMAKSADIIAGQEAVKEKKLIDAFMREVARDGLAAYGEAEVRGALDAGKIETLLVSEGIERRIVKLKCSSCSAETEKTMREAIEEKHSCGGTLRVIEEKDLAEALIEAAELKGVKVETISTDTAEGSQFLQAFGGLGAFLRYK